MDLYMMLEAIDSENEHDSDSDSENSSFISALQNVCNSNALALMQHTLIACNSIKSMKKGRKRRIWTQPRSGNFFENDLNTCNDDIFQENLRVSRETFQFLTEKLDGMKKQDTIFRKAITLEKQIAVALYTLGSSSKFRTVANLFGIGKSTVTRILEDFTHEVVSALKESFLDKYVSTEQFESSLKAFESMGLPQCFGAILKARFRRIGKGLETSLDHSKEIVEACCILHNLLNERNDEINQK